MRTRTALLFVVGGGLLAFVLLCAGAAPAAAAPPLNVTPTPTPMIPPRAAAQQDVSSSTAHPPRLHGTVFDWGKGNMPAGVTVVLRGDGWEMPAQTDASGQYAYQNIGDEVAFLNVNIPADREDLFLMTSDLPVRVDAGGELIVNIALYPKGVTPDPLVHLKMDASFPEVAQDQDVAYTITVLNYREGISRVIVADHMPAGLTFVRASASQGEALYEGGLVWVELGSMAAGGSATVTVVAKVGADVEPGTTILNKAAVYYSENAAVQNEAPITVVQHTNGVLPVTGVSPVLPVAGALLAGLLLGVRRVRRRLA